MSRWRRLQYRLDGVVEALREENVVPSGHVCRRVTMAYDLHRPPPLGTAICRGYFSGIVPALAPQPWNGGRWTQAYRSSRGWLCLKSVKPSTTSHPPFLQFPSCGRDPSSSPTSPLLSRCNGDDHATRRGRRTSRPRPREVEKFFSYHK